MTRAKPQSTRDPKGRGKRGRKGRGGRKDYYQKLSQKKAINRWSEGEYLRLVALVRDHGENWDKISESFTNKTAKQCMQKFKNSARSAKKGNWTSEEDRILMEWIRNHGPNKWTECSKNIRGRCGKQCRERWVNILNPGVKKGNWTIDEQRLIFHNLKRFLTSWSLMAKELDGRTENSIKNYFYSSVRRLKSNSIIGYLRAVYADEGQTEAVPDYPGRLQAKAELLVQNREKMVAEIAKLNCLSKLICEFMLDFAQVEAVATGRQTLADWTNGFDEYNQEFLRFLIEIILELNAAKGRGPGKRKGARKENRLSRKQKPRSVSRKASKRGPSKILNQNVINQPVYAQPKPRLETPGASGLGVECVSRHVQLEQQMFSDFKSKFFEANLDKVISWEELRSIALAMEQRDWGYVKYILTIICLMLKSYQNISQSAQSRGSPGADSMDVAGVMQGIQHMSLSSELTREKVQDQLKSLGNIFKKMKHIEVQMNISNCWKCHSNLCLLHPLKPTMPSAPAFKPLVSKSPLSLQKCNQKGEM